MSQRCNGKPEALKIGLDLQRRVTLNQVRCWMKVFPGSGNSFTKSQMSRAASNTNGYLIVALVVWGQRSDQKYLASHAQELGLQAIAEGF